MRTYPVILLCCLFVIAPAVPSLGTGALHTFTTTDGRTLKATVLAYNAGNKKIQIEREDGKKIWILPAVFSEPDREYIQQWIAADQFMSSFKFMIEGSYNKNKISKTKTEIVYTITLKNKMDHPLTDLKIEYRAFVLSKSNSGSLYQDANRIDAGELYIAKIPAKTTVTQKLRPTVLFVTFSKYDEVDQHFNRTGATLETKTFQEYLEGFWIKIYGPAVDGKTAIREWCFPSDTSKRFQWQGKTTLPTLQEREGGEREKHSKIADLKTQAESLLESNPQKAIDLYLEAYEGINGQKWTFSEEYEIGRVYIEYLKPPNIQLGLKWLKKSLRSSARENYRLFILFSKAYLHPGEYYNVQEAIRYARRAVSSKSDSPEAQKQLATSYAHDGQFDKAIKHQERAINNHNRNKERPNSPQETDLSELEATLRLYQNKKVK